MEHESILKKLYQKKCGYGALCILAFFVMIAIFAEFFAPYDFEKEDRTNPYQPPSKIHIFDETGSTHLPFVYKRRNYLNQYRERVYENITCTRYPVRLFHSGDPYRLWGMFPCTLHLFGVDESVGLHLFGSDNRGRDLLSRIIMGSRISLSIGVIGVFISLMLGTLIGGISGYFGGKIDSSIMRIAEFFMMVPTFYLLLAIRSSLPPHLSSFQVYLLVTCLLSLIGWAGLARILRGMVIALREQEYVLASRLLGSSHLFIIFRHILPHTFSYLLVVVSVAIPGYILAESALSMLGLGIQEPFVSWGMLLSDALSVTQLRYHIWLLAPGMVIFIVVLCFNILGDTFRDILDPKHIR